MAALKPVPTRQLSFDFDARVPAKDVPAEPVVTATIEILPPETKPEPQTYFAPSLGQVERQFLQRQIDKYEDRALRAIWAFVIATCLAVFVKGGIPVSQAILEKLGLPAVNNARLLAGMLGAASVVFAILTVYYALRRWQHSPQLELVLLRKSLAGKFVRLFFAIFVLLLVAMFVVVIYLTGRDILYMVTYLWDRQWYIMDGWEPVKSK